MAEVQEQETQQGQDQKNQGKQNQGKPQYDRSSDSEARRTVDPRRKRTIRFVLLALLVVAAIVAIPVYAYYAARENTDDAQVEGHFDPMTRV